MVSYGCPRDRTRWSRPSAFCVLLPFASYYHLSLIAFAMDWHSRWRSPVVLPCVFALCYSSVVGLPLLLSHLCYHITVILSLLFYLYYVSVVIIPLLFFFCCLLFLSLLVFFCWVIFCSSFIVINIVLFCESLILVFALFYQRICMWWTFDIYSLFTFCISTLFCQ